jgi:hypothetical protein
LTELSLGHGHNFAARYFHQALDSDPRNVPAICDLQMIGMLLVIRSQAELLAPIHSQ